LRRKSKKELGEGVRKRNEGGNDVVSEGNRRVKKRVNRARPGGEIEKKGGGEVKKGVQLEIAQELTAASAGAEKKKKEPKGEGKKTRNTNIKRHSSSKSRKDDSRISTHHKISGGRRCEAE